MWKRLEHRNIVPFLGITTTPFQLISEWMPGGTLTEHVREHPDADRHRLVGVPPVVLNPIPTPNTRYPMLLAAFTISIPVMQSMAISRGYVIDESCFTAVLTCVQPKILVDATGHARITDFGLTTVTKNLDLVRSAALWTAPEILKENGTFSKEADIFSFAMVMIEVGYEQVIFLVLCLTATMYYHRDLPARFRSVIWYLRQP